MVNSQVCVCERERAGVEPIGRQWPRRPNQSIGLFLVINLMQKRFLMQKIHDKIVKRTIAIIGRLRVDEKESQEMKEKLQFHASRRWS
jgi:hypothetical protein